VSGQQPAGGYPPPQRKKRHWGRRIFLGLLGLIALIVIIAVANSGGSGVSTAPSGTASTPAAGSGPTTARAAAPAGTGSYFDVKDSSGDTYRVTLDKTIDPAQGADEFSKPDNGKRFVGTVFTITAVSGSPQDEDADTNAAIVGSDGQTYTPDFNSIAGYTNFSNGQINVAQGQRTTGAVTFQVPTGVKVSKVQWTSSAGFGGTVQWNAS
jgi:hypothetical protein